MSGKSNNNPASWVRSFTPSSEKPLPKPLMNSTKYKLPSGTKIHVKLINGESYEGTVLVNPSATKFSNVIELIHCVNVTFGNGLKESDSMTLQENEIDEVFELQRPDKKELPKREITMATVVVDDKPRLDAFISLCGSEITELGLKFVGFGRGRYAKIAWILTGTKGVLMPIDVVTLEQKNIDVFEMLKNPLFENENVLKILHNCRSEVDYLFHRHSIDLQNVFDTQLMDYLLDKRTENLPELPAAGSGADGQQTRRKAMLPLYTTLGKYLHRIVMEKELLLIKHYSGKDELTQEEKDNPFMVRPMENQRLLKFMALSVKFLLHLKDAIEKIKNNKFTKLHEEYVRSTIDLGMGIVKATLYDDEELPIELPQIVDYVFNLPATATKAKESSLKFAANKSKPGS